MKRIENKPRSMYLRNILIYILFLAFSFGILYICTASSPRYAINPWNDANAFLTMGRAMADGKIIYKDIFEQKGPLLYLLHAIAALISDSSFLGVYVMQSLSLSIFAFAAYKLASLYTGLAESIACTVLTCFITVNSTCYYYGDSAEEFCLPLLMISLYYFCKYFKNPEQYKIGKFTFFLIGFFAGCVAIIKFTVIGFWFAWAAYVLLYIWIAKKSFKDAFFNALVFLGGMAAAVVPWVVYFALNNALSDFINTYFVLNATAYPKVEGLNFITRLFAPIHSLGENLVISPAVLVLGLLGIVLFAVTNIFTEKKFFSRISIPFVCVLGLYIIYFGIRYYNYYLIPLSPFLIFFFVAVAKLFEKLLRNKSAVVSAILCVVIIPSAIVASNCFNLSSKHAARKGEITVQSDLADYISDLYTPGEKILNYGCLDFGVYLSMKQVPYFKHFERQNLLYEKYPDNIDEQNRYIAEKLPDYVVVSTAPGSELDDYCKKDNILNDNYDGVIYNGYTIYESPLTDKKTVRNVYLFLLKEE